MRVAFLGRTQFLMKTIELFENTEHEIAGIGTCKAAPEYLVNEQDFEKKAKQLGVPFFCNPRMNTPQVWAVIKEMRADIAISVNWLTVINENTLNLFPYGILNGHCGDLPRYRGNACPNWAMICGESAVGVSVHFMKASELDSGDIVVKRLIKLSKDTTIGDIYERTEELFPEMFLEAVTKIGEQGRKAGIPQSKNRDDILRCYPRMPSDSYIDWNRPSADIDRLVRASGYPFSGAYSYINGTDKIYIYKVRMEKYEFPSVVVSGQIVYRNCEKKEVGVAAKDGVIIIEEASDAEHKVRNVTQLIKSTRDRLGMVVPDSIYELKKEIEELKNKIIDLENKIICREP